MLTNNLIYVSTRLDKNQFQLKNYCIIKILRKIISPHVPLFNPRNTISSPSYKIQAEQRRAERRRGGICDEEGEANRHTSKNSFDSFDG